MMNPTEIYERLTLEGDRWADEHAAAELWESTLKQVWSKCVIKYRNDGCAVSEAEHRATIDPEYIQSRSQATDARLKANKAKVRYKSAEAWFEAQRSAEATHRAASRAAP